LPFVTPSFVLSLDLCLDLFALLFIPAIISGQHIPEGIYN
jgi:hypothetical protein